MLSLCLFAGDAVSDSLVTAFCAQPQTFMPVGQLHVHAPIASIVTIIGRPISYQILRPQLSRDLCKRTFQRKHVAGKERGASSFFTQAHEVFVALVLDLTGLYARHGAGKARFGRDSEQGCFGSLGDIDRVVYIGAAISIIAISNDNQGASSLRRSHFLVAELPDRIVKRGLLAGLLDSKNRAVQQFKPVSEVLSQRNLIVESSKQHPISFWTNDSLNEVHCRLLLKL